MFMRSRNTDFDRRMRAAVLAGGLAALAPVAVRGAELDTNIVLNPGFELVNTGQTGPFDAVRILDWIDTDGDNDDTFAYAYSQDYSGVNEPPGAGTYHYSGGFNTTVGQVLIHQVVDVSTGTAAGTIATGIALYDLSAYFSGYLTQPDSTAVRARFLGAGDVELGTSLTIGGVSFRSGLGFMSGRPDWGQDRAAGSIPEGTLSIAVEVLADVATANHDGYLDLIDLRVIKPDVLTLRVSASSGSTQLVNNSGSPIEIDYYEILHPGGSLDPTGWSSLMDQDFEGGGPPQSPRVGDGWEEAGGSSATVLSESFLQGSSVITHGQVIDLGDAFSGAPAGTIFSFGTPDGTLFRGLVEILTFVLGDMNGDGALDAFDVAPFELALANPAQYMAQFPGLDPVERGDFTGDGSFNAFDVSPFEVALASASTPVPEPATLTLLGLGLLALRRRQAS